MMDRGKFIANVAWHFVTVIPADSYVSLTKIIRDPYMGRRHLHRRNLQHKLRLFETTLLHGQVGKGVERV